MIQTIEKWHQCMSSRDMSILDELLDEEVVFHSPVVWTPQKGKKMTTFYLMAADQVLGGGHFSYQKEIIGERQACLEFESKIGDTVVNGVDIISWNEEGKITEFKVMVRPLQAVNAIWKSMQMMLENMGYKK
ncbi:MAG: nuclear transport factor 2 family protein [Bacteroidia bacterium]|nr:nuclear transport factor 2 family protein [Bacteroidia bacterium]